MSYQRLYPQRINWEDEPSLATPINQVNLNKMDSALYGIDGRVVELDENKVGKTETFNTSRNGVVPKPTQADITNEKVLRADGVWVEQSGGGGGGGGHTIVNNAGTSLTQRGKLKTVGGLNATDDSTNDTTKITDEYEEIPWTTWQGYTAAQKAQHPNAIVTDAPDCDGDVEIENMHLAWENPNPTQAFPATEADRIITLDTDGDYDGIEIEFAMTQGAYRKTIRFSKGTSAIMEIAYYDNSTPKQCTNFTRLVTWVNDSTLSISDCNHQLYNVQSTANQLNVPTKVYTYKNKFTAKIQAIAHDVSTEASKCMLDENTSVEDAINANNMGTAIDVKSYTSANPYTTQKDGYLYLGVGSGQSSLAWIKGSTGSTVIAMGGTAGFFSCFIKKGMKIYASNSPTTLNFFELS